MTSNEEKKLETLGERNARTTAYLEAMGWAVSVDSERHCWRFSYASGPTIVRFDLPDSLSEFRELNGLSAQDPGEGDYDQPVPEAYARWLDAIERLALNIYLAITSVEGDFRLSLGMPPTPPEDSPYNPNAESSLSDLARQIESSSGYPQQVLPGPYPYFEGEVYPEFSPDKHLYKYGEPIATSSGTITTTSGTTTPLGGKDD